MLYVLLTICMLTVLQFGIYYSYKHKKQLNAYLQLPPRSNLSRLIFSLMTGIFYGFLLVFIHQHILPQPNDMLVQDEQIASAYPNTLPNKNEQFRQLEHEEFQQLENYYYLYTSADTSQSTLQKTALYLKKNLCKKPCTINFYDNSHAYTLDRQRVTLGTDTDMQMWNAENYVFVANHYLGYLGTTQNTFSYFPYQDAYYQKLLQK